MERRAIFTILLVVLAVVVATAIGMNVYQAGVARGLAESGQVTPPPAGPGPYPYYYGPYWHRPFGFGFFGFLFPLLFILLLFALLRGAFWGWRGPGHYGPWKYGGVPPAFEEWHRKAHESQQQGQKM